VRQAPKGVHGEGQIAKVSGEHQGSHQIAVKKKGFTVWTRMLNVTGGAIHLSAELDQESPKQ